MGNSFTRDDEGRSPRRHLERTCNEQQTGPASQAWTRVGKHAPSPAPGGQVFLGSRCPTSRSQGILGPDHGGARRKMPVTARCTSARGPDAHTCQSGPVSPGQGWGSGSVLASLHAGPNPSYSQSLPSGVSASGPGRPFSRAIHVTSLGFCLPICKMGPGTVTPGRVDVTLKEEHM